MIHASPLKNFQPFAPHQHVEANLLEILRHLIQDSAQSMASPTAITDGQDRSAMIACRLFLDWLRIAGRHNLYFGHPGCPGMTMDERQVIDTLASAQNQHWSLLNAHLTWLAERRAHAPLTAASVAIGRILAETGRFLMMPRPAVTIPHQGPWRLRLVSDPINTIPKSRRMTAEHHKNQA